MKKKIAILVMFVMLVSLPLVLTGCNNDDETLEITQVTMELKEGVRYSKDSAFNTGDVIVTAELSDDTTLVITKNLVWDMEDLELNDDNEFTQEGVFELKVDFLKYKNITLEIEVSP